MGPAAQTAFIHTNTPYVMVSGTTVADKWSDLVDDTIDNTINIDENGNKGGTVNVWANVTTAGWTAGSLMTCNTLARLFCFQQ